MTLDQTQTHYGHTGTMLGILVGLLVDSYLVVLGGAWGVIAFWWVYILIFVILVAGGIAMNETHLIGRIPRQVTIIGFCVLLPLAVVGPYQLRKMEMEAALAAIPTYPGAKPISSRIAPVAGDSLPFACRDFSIDPPVHTDRLLEYYRTALVRAGWTEHFLSSTYFGQYIRASKELHISPSCNDVVHKGTKWEEVCGTLPAPTDNFSVCYSSTPAF